MSEWIEQPAFETNEFKPGDRVNVYDVGDITDGTVETVSGNVIFLENINIGIGFHFKQCRLLKKREPREWEVLATQFAPNREDVSLRFTAVNGPKMKHGDVIRVREVLDE